MEYTVYPSSSLKNKMKLFDNDNKIKIHILVNSTIFDYTLTRLTFAG